MSSVNVTLGIITEGFKKGLEEARHQTEKFKHEVEGGGGLLSGLGGKIAGGLAAAGIGEFFKNIIEKADQIGDLAEKFDVPAEALQKVGNVADKSGASIESVAGAMNKLVIAQDKALSGDVGMIDSFKQLGVTVEDLKNLSPDQIMAKIGQSGMNAAPMVAVMGKNALELRETLSQLKDSKESGIIAKEDVNTLKQLKDDAVDVLHVIESWGASVAGGLVRKIKEAQTYAGALMVMIESMMERKGMKQATADAMSFIDDADKAAAAKEEAAEKEKAERREKIKANQLDERLKSAEEDGNREVENAQGKAIAARDRFYEEQEKQRLKGLDDELSGYKERAGMNGQQIAAKRHGDLRELHATERAERQFIRKHGGGELGKATLQELKDSKDPVKQAQLAMERASANMVNKIEMTRLIQEQIKNGIDQLNTRSAFPKNS